MVLCHLNIVVKGQFMTLDRFDGFYFNFNSQCDFITYDSTKTRFYMPTSEKQVDYSTMAGVALSRLYATNYAWNRGIFEDSTEHAYFGIKKEKFEAIKTLNPKTNYIVPVLEYHYTIDKEEAGVFFGIAHTDGDRVFPVIMAGVKKAGKWYSSNRLMSSQFQIYFISFKAQILARIMERKPIGVPMFDTLLQRILTNNRVDIEKLHREYIRIQNEKGDEYNYFINDQGKAAFKEKSPLKAQKITTEIVFTLQIEAKKDNYEDSKKYQVDIKKAYFKNHIAEKAILEYEKVTAKDSIFFNIKKSFYYQSKPIAIVKYQKNGKFKTVEVEMVNGKAMVVNNPRFENMRMVMQAIKKEKEYEFENFLKQKTDKNYKIGKYYIPLNHINYDRMADILKDKPVIFAPFCDYE